VRRGLEGDAWRPGGDKGKKRGGAGPRCLWGWGRMRCFASPFPSTLCTGVRGIGDDENQIDLGYIYTHMQEHLHLSSSHFLLHRPLLIGLLLFLISHFLFFLTNTFLLSQESTKTFAEQAVERERM
jgi:hypothetical protein